jgi:holo-[acyl-carrier protein] synthase
MILGVGVDVLRIARMEAELARDDGGFREDVYTPHEIAACRQHPRPAVLFAQHFASKEAVLKALGTGVLDGASWREVEVTPPAGVMLRGRIADVAAARGARRIHLTLASTPDWAVAAAVLAT